MQIKISDQLLHKIQICSGAWLAFFPRELSLLPNANARIDRILDAVRDLLEHNPNHWSREQRLQFRKSYRYAPAADCPFRFQLLVAQQAAGHFVVMDVSEDYRQSSAGGEESCVSQ